jgi:DNA-binding GntR family transcriptional regulator
VSRSSLVTLLYQSAREAACSADEHAALLDAVARRDVPAARRLMQEHLGHVESGLALPDEAPREVDLRAVLALERS